MHAANAERWLPIAEYPGYEVSSHGRVRSLEFRNGKTRMRRRIPLVMRHTFSGSDRSRPAVSLCRDGIVRTRQIARLVLEAFIGPCPKGMECSHLNGNPVDNRVENLAWMTHRDNIGMKELHGTSQRGERGGRAVVSDDDVREIRRLRAQGLRIIELAAIYGICESQASNIARRLQWTHI